MYHLAILNCGSFPTAGVTFTSDLPSEDLSVQTSSFFQLWSSQRSRPHRRQVPTRSLLLRSSIVTSLATHLRESYHSCQHERL
jgi:hypothetical protein